MQLLVDRREDLVGQRTSTVHRPVWRIHELDPARSPGILNYPKYRTALREWLAGQPGIVAEFALQELADITRLTDDINALENRITDRVHKVAPQLYGNPGMRRGDRSENHGRDRTRHPLLRGGGVRPTRRFGPNSTLVGTHRRTDASTEIR